MALKLFDSRRRKKVAFKPLHGKTVSMYVCGVTPYDTTHLGHASTFTFFDTLSRYLALRGFDVRYVQNITDIDEDILKRARETNTEWRGLVKRWSARYIENMRRLNVCWPKRYYRATDFMDEMAAMVKRLMRMGLAYESGWAVYFDTAKFKRYGYISSFTHKQMVYLLTEREEHPDYANMKRPEDFRMWVRSRYWEPSWDTAMGTGRPGWHIECATIINTLLGPKIDIQGGGSDLMFPHHEDTAAILDSISGDGPYASHFMHTGMILKNGEKMSKSLGNLIMLSDLLKRYTPNAIRWVLLSHHYRSVWELDMDELRRADERVRRVERAIKSHGGDTGAGMERFFDAMDDDMDTPRALEVLEEAGGGRSAAKMFSTLGFA
jgi:L-cysteine:1D-myo-inositol 2-amino-2-deoxy-alpha-D-glucopyranoside ligase